MDTELTLLQDIKSALWILIVIVGIGVVVNYGNAPCYRKPSSCSRAG
jgi:hypothetical protein